MPVLAHAGHRLISLIYVVPVMAFVAINAIRDRRSGRDRDADELAKEPTLNDILDGPG